MRLCFNLAFAAGLASVALWAVGPLDTEVAAPGRITTVIRPDARTGKLVRRVTMTPQPVVEQRVVEALVAPRVVSPVVVGPETKAPAAGGIDEAIEQIAAQVSLPSQLIHSVIKVESNYNPFAISPKGAQGLMQLIPATAHRFDVANSFNPAENIQGGVRHLKYLLNTFGDTRLALAAYNAGENAVRKYNGVPPYPETRNYVSTVLRNYGRYALIGTATAAEAPPPPEPEIQQFVNREGMVVYTNVPWKYLESAEWNQRPAE
jgi:hypothetical protein